MSPESLHDATARAATLVERMAELAWDVSRSAEQLAALSIATPDAELRELWLVLTSKRGRRR